MRRLPRILRIVAAAVSLVISLSLFCGSGVALSNWAAFQLGPALAGWRRRSRSAHSESRC